MQFTLIPTFDVDKQVAARYRAQMDPLLARESLTMGHTHPPWSSHMGTISQIDAGQPLVFYPSIAGKVDVPEMMELANELQNPDLLNCERPIEGLEFVVAEAATVQAVLGWLQSHARWRDVVESSLQCLAVDRAGRPLLTAFIPMEVFEDLAGELATTQLIPCLRETLSNWMARGATTVFLEGFRLAAPSAVPL